MEKWAWLQIFFPGKNTSPLCRLLVLCFLLAECGRPEPAKPGNWMAAGKTYTIDIHIETKYLQSFAGHTYLDTTRDFSQWKLYIDRQVKDTLWCQIGLLQTQPGAPQVFSHLDIRGIPFRLVGGKPDLANDSLHFYTENYRMALVKSDQNTGMAASVKSKQLIIAWLQPNVVVHLVTVLFGVNPKGFPVAGRSWEGQLPVWHPVPGNFRYRGKIAFLTLDTMTLALQGRYENVDAVNMATLLPLGGQFKGKMSGLIQYPAKGAIRYRFLQRDSLSGHMVVAGRRVPSVAIVETEITVNQQDVLD
jgi:hypothetical protein